MNSKSFDRRDDDVFEGGICYMRPTTNNALLKQYFIRNNLNWNIHARCRYLCLMFLIHFVRIQQTNFFLFFSFYLYIELENSWVVVLRNILFFRKIK